VTELCPDGNPTCQVCAVKDLEEENARLRRELANALAVNSGRTYCMDSPEVLKARIGELERELAEVTRERDGARQAQGMANKALRELAEARATGAHAAQAVELCRFTYRHAAEGMPCSDAEAQAYEASFKTWWATDVAARAAAEKKEADRG
jgi:hypothetical protein